MLCHLQRNKIGNNARDNLARSANEEKRSFFEFYMQITKTLENPVFSRVLFCAVFYRIKGKVADCHKKSLEKVDGYFHKDSGLEVDFVISGAIKLGDYNVGRSEQILTLPLYMAFLLRAL